MKTITIGADGDMSELMQAMADIRRENEREYGETFSAAKVADRMGPTMTKEHVERLESGEEPIARDLTGLVRALHGRLTVTVESAVREEKR